MKSMDLGCLMICVMPPYPTPPPKGWEDMGYDGRRVGDRGLVGRNNCIDL